MATRDGSGEKPAAKEPEQRPGSYVQVLAPRRKRGAKRDGRASSAPGTPVSERAIEQPLTSRSREASEERRGSGPAVARRALGPLGMDEARSEPEPVSEPKRASSPVPPRLNVVEINPELDEPPLQASVVAVRPVVLGSRDELPAEHANEPHDDGWDAAMAVARTAIDSEPPRSRPPSIQHLDPDPWRAYQAAIVQPASASAAPAPLARISSEELRAALSRPAIPSVLDARPTLQPSPLPPSEKPTLGWWLLVGALSSVIAAAGYLAIGQLLRAERAQHDVPVVEELAPRAAPEPTAKPAADVPARGASEPAPPSARGEGAAPAPAIPSPEARPAGAVVAPSAPPERVAPVAAARPALAPRSAPAKRAPAAQPAVSAAPAAEPLPSNPYED